MLSVRSVPNTQYNISQQDASDTNHTCCTYVALSVYVAVLGMPVGMKSWKKYYQKQADIEVEPLIAYVETLKMKEIDREFQTF